MVTTQQISQCDAVALAFLKSALPKTITVPSAAHHHLIFAPSEVMGLGYEDLVEMLEHTLLPLDHDNGSTVTGQLIHVLVEGTLVERG